MNAVYDSRPARYIRILGWDVRDTVCCDGCRSAHRLKRSSTRHRAILLAPDFNAARTAHDAECQPPMPFIHPRPPQLYALNRRPHRLRQGVCGLVVGRGESLALLW